MKNSFLSFVTLIILLFVSMNAQEKKEKELMASDTFNGLKFRSIGPAYCSGRIADFAVNPDNHSEFYVGVACGNVWKTTNAGITFEPVFDSYGSYSIGVVSIDPNNTNVVWVGSGENNHQRALAYGDGVYKSIDGGKSWNNMGLKDSRQIGGIVIDPRNSDNVFVAAEGSAWGPGGDRGLYKTIDGGKTWKKVLEVSENTGVNNIIFDPRDPDVMYATSEQRRRHVFTKIGGGPESAVYKSYDGGENWEKIMEGLPKEDIGGMGIAISPVNPDVIYLIVEAANDAGGFFRTTNRGATWDKMSDYTSSGQYFNEIYADPVDVDRVYSLETYSKYTEDGGKTWKNISAKNRHVDDHAMWIDPNDNKHLMIGGDGGVYISYDQAEKWDFIENLPVTQFYRVYTDNEEPFYNVYGGTQDNNSMGGPSRTISSDGIVNSDWFVTNGGDGFWTAADPVNPDIVYAEAQYGNMVRYDRLSGEAIDIRPEPREGELTYRWNWNTPLILSPHSATRLYCAANKVFRSDDRGNTWKVISDDLTAQIDRNTWKVMGKYWSADAVAKDVSTSLYNTIVSISESPKKENLIYIGTDDGVIQRTEDAEHWTKLTGFKGVPEYTYVSDLLTDRFDENVVYASFDNMKRDDFKPYLFKSNDKGDTWKSISGDLPENGTVHSIIQDFKNPDLLFVGTEFGVFFTIDGGKKWTQLKSGLPTVSVYDLTIQERECDLVLATFGRGFYILDDYSSLRNISKDYLEKTDASIFEVKDALMYVPSSARYGQGDNYFKAKNPDFGATITYYLKDVPKTLKETRHEEEGKLFEKGEKIPMPTVEDLRKEELEIAPYLVFTIKDEAGNIVRKLTQKPGKGVNRITWDLNYYDWSPVSVKNDKFDPVAKMEGSTLAMPGKYTVDMSIVVREEEKHLSGPVGFEVKPLNNTTLPAENRADMVAFQKKSGELVRAIRGAEKFTVELNKRNEYIKQALLNTPSAEYDLMLKADKISKELEDILFQFNGQKPKASWEEVPPAITPLNHRADVLVYVQWRSTSAPTSTQRSQYDILAKKFPPVLERIKNVYEQQVKPLEAQLEKLGGPWTPGRLPEWNK